MGLFDFLKKKKDAEAPGDTPEGLASLDGAELAELEPPETRYTQEYQEYLASLEDAEQEDAPSDSVEEGG